MMIDNRRAGAVCDEQEICSSQARGQPTALQQMLVII
jgi:hypothetical protein